MVMNAQQWIDLFFMALESKKDSLEQVLQLQSCREHWIQAEISLYAWFKEEMSIWTDYPIDSRRKADLFASDDDGQALMVAEVKCLADGSYSKCLTDDKFSIPKDIERLREINVPVRLFLLVIAKGEKETSVGKRLRETDWVSGSDVSELDFGFAKIRMWAI